MWKDFVSMGIPVFDRGETSPKARYGKMFGVLRKTYILRERLTEC
jgi:hypothetical protein